MRQTSSTWTLGLLVVIALVASPAVAQVSLEAGDDGWATPKNGTSVDLTQFGAVARAFGAKSVSPKVVSLTGQPIDSENLGNIDTIVRRVGSVDFGSGRNASVELEFIALSLQSKAPVKIEYDDGSVEQWDLRVCLSSFGGGGGVMDLTLNNGDGGTFNSSLNVLPRLIFSRDGSADVVIDCGRGGCREMSVNSTASGWVRAGGPGGFSPDEKKVPTIQRGLPIDSDCDGAPDTEADGSSNFFAGFAADAAANFPVALTSHDHPPVAQHQLGPASLPTAAALNPGNH